MHSDAGFDFANISRHRALPPNCASLCPPLYQYIASTERGGVCTVLHVTKDLNQCQYHKTKCRQTTESSPLTWPPDCPASRKRVNFHKLPARLVDPWDQTCQGGWPMGPKMQNAGWFEPAPAFDACFADRVKFSHKSCKQATMIGAQLKQFFCFLFSPCFPISKATDAFFFLWFFWLNRTEQFHSSRDGKVARNCLILKT